MALEDSEKVADGSPDTDMPLGRRPAAAVAPIKRLRSAPDDRDRSLTFGSLYGPEHDFPPTTPVKRVILGAVPRSGSTYIGLRLWHTGVFGAPLEYLNARDRLRQALSEGADFASYWNDILRRRTSPNGVFSMKLFAQDYLDLLATVPEALPQLRADHLIFLRRRNLLAQAISYDRAARSGEWVADRQGTATAYSYDFERALSALSSLLVDEARWLRLADASGASPITINYEDFLARPAVEIARALRFCRISDPPSSARTGKPIRMQRDDQSRAAVRRFMQDLAVLRPALLESLVSEGRIPPAAEGSPS